MWVDVHILSHIIGKNVRRALFISFFFCGGGGGGGGELHMAPHNIIFFSGSPSI